MKRLLVFFVSLFTVTAMYSQSTEEAWHLNGDNITDSQFLGSTNGLPLVFKAYHLAGCTGDAHSNVSFGWAALIYSNNNNISNTAFGVQAQSYNNGNIVNGDTVGIGSCNTSIGNFALMSNSGSYNIAIGTEASAWNARSTTTTAIGKSSLLFNYSDDVEGANGVTCIGDSAALFGYNVPLVNADLYTNGSAEVVITATGHSALMNNTGYGNTAHGYSALKNNATGKLNVAIGSEALHLNTTGGENTAIGWKALLNNTTGEDNTAVGAEALMNNTTVDDTIPGMWNVAMGYNSLKNNTTGSLNIAVGSLSLFRNTIGGQNVAIGKEALANNVKGNMSTAVGYQALFNNVTDSIYNNIAVGYQTLYNNTSGYGNTALGVSALFNNTTGNNNTAFGFEALKGNTTGYDNTAVGYGADVASGDLYNATAIGSGAKATASNQVTIGNTAVTSIKVYADYSILSDSRVKKNIRQNVPGLAFIKKLQPVTYNIDPDAVDNLLGVSKENKNVFSENEIAARKLREQEVHTGFVAQDVEKAAESLGFDFSGVDNTDRNVYGLRYSEFVVPLVKAVQELSTQNENKNAAIASLQKQIEELEMLKNLILANKNGIK